MPKSVWWIVLDNLYLAGYEAGKRGSPPLPRKSEWWDIAERGKKERKSPKETN